MYLNKMQDYILQHQVEDAPPGPTAAPKFYLPHHAVKKEKRKAIIWRFVFDASSHEPGSPSLNDFLEMGPNLLPEILSILLRFRLHKYAILGDVSQAFLQISLDPTDRDLTRFLWYRFVPVRVPMILQRMLSLIGSLDCPSGLPVAPFSFRLQSAHWPRCTTTRIPLHLHLWTGSPIWMTSQLPRCATSSLYSPKLRR